MTPDGVLTVIVLGVQLWLIWRTYRLSREAEARAQRHDRVSVRPALEFLTRGEAGSLQLVLKNVGKGPAAIVEQTFIVDGRPVRPGDDPDPSKVIYALLATVGLPPTSLQNIHEVAPNTWMGVDEEHITIKIAIPTFAREQAFALRDRIRIKMTYRSLYPEDEYEADSGFVTRNPAT